MFLADIGLIRCRACLYSGIRSRWRECDRFLACAQHFSQGSNPLTSCKRCREDAFLIYSTSWRQQMRFLVHITPQTFMISESTQSQMWKFHIFESHIKRPQVIEATRVAPMFGPRNELLHESWTLLGWTTCKTLVQQLGVDFFALEEFDFDMGVEPKIGVGPPNHPF